jgi:hypothetical protein
MLRAAAGTAGTATLAGCGLFGDAPEPTPERDAAQPVLDEALALAAAYDRAVVAVPALAGRLTPLAEAHRAHAAELTRVIGAAALRAVVPAPSGSAPVGGANATTAALRTAEQKAQRTAVTVCRAAPRNRAALLASIAAARATHVEALRRST